MSGVLANVAAVVQAFHWPPSEIERLPLRELAWYAELASNNE